MNDFNVDAIYGSGSGAYLKASDLIINGRPTRVAVVIEAVNLEPNFNKDGQQIVLSFVGKEKRFGLNKTNSNMLANLFNDRNAGNWVGKTISIRPDKTQNMKGEMVDCIRVDFELPPQQPFTPKTSPVAQMTATNSEIPTTDTSFNFGANVANDDLECAF